MQLSVDEAVPCGLVINELVSNALKHAFPAGRGGRVWVRMRAAQDRHVLQVGDDGKGPPEGFELAKSNTLGLQLVRTLTDQLGGSLEVKTGNNTEFTVSFPRRPGTA